MVLGGDPIYLAHIAYDGREQTIQEHLIGTASLCCKFADSFGAGAMGQLMGMAHDLGKYSTAFQQRLYGGQRVDHATAGAIECLRINHPYAAYCVIGHHGGLPDYGVKDEIGNGTFCGRINSGLNDVIEDKNITYTILEIDGRRISRIKMQKETPFVDTTEVASNEKEE